MERARYGSGLWVRASDAEAESSRLALGSGERPNVDERALGRVVQHVSTHNRIVECDEMWAQHKKVRRDRERGRERRERERERRDRRDRHRDRDLRSARAHARARVPHSRRRRRRQERERNAQSTRRPGGPPEAPAARAQHTPSSLLAARAEADRKRMEAKSTADGGAGDPGASDSREERRRLRAERRAAKSARREGKAQKKKAKRKRRDEAGGRFCGSDSSDGESNGESEAAQEVSGAADQSVATECAGASGDTGGEAVDELERRRRRAERFKKEWAELGGPSRQ